MKSSDQVLEQEQQLTEKTKKRRRILKKIIRNNRQIASDKELQIFITLDKELYAGFNYFRLGNFCIQENRLDLAQENLKKTIHLIEKKFLFTNVYLSLGNLERKKQNKYQAIEYYNKVLKQSPHFNSKLYSNKDQVVFAGKLNSFNSFLEAHNSLMQIYVQINQLEKGFQVCKVSTDLKQEEQSAIMNFAQILQNYSGKRNLAIDFARNKLVQTVRKQSNQDFILIEPIKITPYCFSQFQKQPSQSLKKINVFTLKWGSKYSCEYVNNLYSAIKKKTTWIFDFYCLTDDSYGINKDIHILSLDDEWKKQWGKALLFHHKIHGKNLYIDLDFVITGSLDDIFNYQGKFATLRKPSGKIDCSLMIWHGDYLNPVYQNLFKKFQIIRKKLVKFDSWMDLIIEEADDLSIIHNDKIVLFNQNKHKKFPENTTIIRFQKRPKPDEYPVDWIKKYWNCD